MKRIIDHHLIQWKDYPYRKPLLLRGARQVGKTYAVRQLGKTFDNFVEINFEVDIGVKAFFEQGLHPERIIQQLSTLLGKQIVPGKTLLFFDEIQGFPLALTALRYFYENLPELHVIAAGSLLDFAIQEVGIPVGRVESLYVYPLSFFEFLCATEYQLLAQYILHQPLTAETTVSEPIHQQALALIGKYLAIGGMPEAVKTWQATKDPQSCSRVHQALIDTYRQDFNKYAKKFQIKYVDAVFNSIPKQLGKKFKYTDIEGDYRKRELAPCIDLLATAGVIHPVTRSAGNGIPIGAEVDPHDFKVIFLDVALSQAMLGLDVKNWLLYPEKEFINKGELVEAFIGQEILAYAVPHWRNNLYYWRRNAPGSEAEIDYLIQDQSHVVPVEVKSGPGSTLKSMHMFLESHPQSPYGLRFSTNNYSQHNKIHSYPLYAAFRVMLETHKQDIASYAALTEE